MSEYAHLSFEQALEKLQLVVKQLESGDQTLEKALKHFEEGVGLAQICQTRLKAIEQKIEILTSSNAEGKISSEPFKI